MVNCFLVHFLPVIGCIGGGGPDGGVGLGGDGGGKGCGLSGGS